MAQDGRGGYQPAAPGTPDKRGPMNIPPNNLPYGRRKQAEASLSAVPMAGSNSATQTPTAPTPTPGQLPITPTDVPNLSDPSAYPSEPLTAGLSSGPGAGPEALHLYAHGNEELSILRGIYLRTGSEDLRKLIEWVEGNS